MSIMEKPEVEFIKLDNIDTTTTSAPISCTSQYCNLQGCPEDECPGFEW